MAGGMRWLSVSPDPSLRASRSAVLRRLSWAAAWDMPILVNDGWEGRHPLGVPVFVVTHRAPVTWPYPDAPFTFVTDGVERAIAMALEAADGRNVGVTAGAIASQALAMGLLDEVWVALVPVLLGGGRPFFEAWSGGPVALDDPEVRVGRGVTHLRYRVERPGT